MKAYAPSSLRSAQADALRDSYGTMVLFLKINQVHSGLWGALVPNHSLILCPHPYFVPTPHPFFLFFFLYFTVKEAVGQDGHQERLHSLISGLGTKLEGITKESPETGPPSGNVSISGIDISPELKRPHKG